MSKILRISDLDNSSSNTGLRDEQAIIEALNDWRACGNSPPEDLALDPENDHVIWLVSPWRRQQVVLSESWNCAHLASVRTKLEQLRKSLAD
jgi:hypothetical protein